MKQTIKSKRTDWGNSAFTPKASARYGTRFTLGCSFKIEVQKKEEALEQSAIIW